MAYDDVTILKCDQCGMLGYWRYNHQDNAKKLADAHEYHRGKEHHCLVVFGKVVRE